MLTLTFLGTGTSQGIPIISCGCWVCKSMDAKDKRLRSSVLISYDDGVQLTVDAGPDFRAQMIREDVKKLDAVLVTHEHKDHVGGLDDVRAFNYTSSNSIDVYASERVQQTLKKDYDYAFEQNPYPGVPRMNLCTISDEKFMVSGHEVIPILGKHFRLPVTGFRFGTLAYLTDFNYISEGEKQKLEGLDVLIINGLRRERHLSHFNISEAIALGRELKAGKIYLTHISHELGSYALTSKELPENVFLAYDGLKIIIQD
ncbi:MAG: MBL fold metallo-hydrolase [Rikenellaceae bacterium]